METKFDYWDGLVGVHESMVLDSGQVVAELEWQWIKVELRVCGDVRVEFDGDTYRYPSDFPDELMALFRKGTAGQDERVCVDMNNWFEALVYDKRGDKWCWTGWSEVLDGDWQSAGDIYDTLLYYLDSYVEDFWLDHAYDVLNERFPDADSQMKDDFVGEYWQNMGSDDWNCAEFIKFINNN